MQYEERVCSTKIVSYITVQGKGVQYEESVCNTKKVK